VLDAQFFGVPQRRRRVFVVGYLGDWRRAAAVLFERHSLQGHHPPSREAGERVASTVIKGAAIGREPHNGPQYGEFLSDGSYYTLNCTEQHAVTHTLRGEGFDASEDGTGRGTPLVPVLYQDSEFGVGEYESAGSLRAGRIPEHQMIIQPAPIAFGWQNSASQGDSVSEIVTPGLDKSKVPAVLAFDSKETNTLVNDDISPCLTTNGETGKSGGRIAVQVSSAVRRLTPRECERLQGFPDDYTAVPYRGKPAADGPRYKALGNSMAVPCMRWIGERIAMVERAHVTVAPPPA
jgi:DNA (cytosine-5)-methyltransferase 1